MRKRSRKFGLGTVKRFLLAVASCWCATSALVLADTSPDSLSALLPQSCYLSGEFQQLKQLNDLPQPLQSSGSFIFSCEQGLIWRTQLPAAETLVYRKDGQHQLLLPNAQAERLKGRVHRELGKILNNLIGADIHYLNENFDSQAEAGQFTLTPKNKRLQRFINTLSLSPSEGGVHIVLLQADKQFTDITIQQTSSFDRIDAQSCNARFADAQLACDLLFR